MTLACCRRADVAVSRQLLGGSTYADLLAARYVALGRVMFGSPASLVLVDDSGLRVKSGYSLACAWFPSAVPSVLANMPASFTAVFLAGLSMDLRRTPDGSHF